MPPKIKCLVWDLDETLWSGILMENDEVAIRPEAKKVLLELDRRGILNSIASRNDESMARCVLEGAGMWEYFLYPKINWGGKADSVEKIGRELNIGFDTLAFIDDQAFDREEVRFSHPSVRTYEAEDVRRLPSLEEFTPEFVTDESAQRRRMYLASIERDDAERDYAGAKEEFLATLGMVMSISHAREPDLRRAEELTVRTNQLNTTGRTYSYEELLTFVESSGYLVLVAQLEDRYGTYGTIGMAVLETSSDEYRLKLLLTSCRVVARGVGSILLNQVIRMANEANVRLVAEFKPNDRNRLMLVTLRFSGFRNLREEGEYQILEFAESRVPASPRYVELRLTPAPSVA